MPSIASDITKLAAAGADATAIAVVVGCSTGCGAILIGATMLGFAVASILEDISDEMKQDARDAKILGGIAALHARIQANDPTAFLHYSAEAQRTAAEALAQAESINIKDIRHDDKRRPYFIFHRILKQATEGIHTSIAGLGDKLDIQAMQADAIGAQLGEIWTGMQLVSESNAMLTELLGRIPKPPAPPAAPTAEHRKRFLALCEKIHGPANLEAFFRDSNTITHGRITIGHLFVEPDLFVHANHGGEFSNQATYMGGGMTAFRVELPESDEHSENPQFDTAELTRHRTQPDDPRKPALAIIAEHPHLVILGDPGAGKTTVLQQHFLTLLANWAADPDEHLFPIFLRLAIWERSGEGQPFAAFGASQFQDLAEAHWELGINPAHIAEWAKASRILLLDGVDEIRDSGKKAKAIESIRLGAIASTRSRHIVTSRPSGYTRGSLGGDWQETTIAPLSDAQAREHLEKWEAIFRSFGEPPKDLPGLLPQLLAHPGLASVTRNALFLHLIVFFHRSNMRLPDDRNDFYSYATTVLSDRWQRRRSGDSSTPPIKFLPQLLATVAIHMMRQGLVTVPEPQFRALINERLVRAGLTEYAAASETDYFIAAARDLIGVIVDKGGDKFGFLHLSFQEFYAADYLLKARDPEYIELAARHWDDLDWAEVWQLHLSAADGDTDRRKLLHQTAKDNSHKTLDETFLRCHLTRLKWAGYAGKSRCALEDESVQWAVGRIREWAHWSYCEEICAILTKWERDLDSSLRDVLHYNLANAEGYVGHEAIIPTLAAHPAGDATLRDMLFAQLGNENMNIGSAAAKALVALSIREDALVEGGVPPPCDA